DALQARLQDCEARVAIVDNSRQADLHLILHRCPSLQQIIGVNYADEYTVAWRSLLSRQESEFTPMQTVAGTPALLLYTSGTIGAPKGVLHAHAALIGALPGFVASQDWFPQPRDVFWTPADWSWGSSLVGALLPTLYFGRPIVATARRFSPEHAFDVLQRYQITNTFLSTSMLAHMMKSGLAPRPEHLVLRSIMATGIPVGQAVHQWCEAALGVVPNEMFGQTEMNFIIGNSRHKLPVKAGSMGLPYPGHRVSLIHPDGTPVESGQIGEIALHRRDPHG